MNQLEQIKTAKLKTLEASLQAIASYQKWNRLKFVFSDDGICSRDRYAKYIRFFSAGLGHRFRLLYGGNGVGKSHTGATEIAYHVTGEYPIWWEGRRPRKLDTVWLFAATGPLFRDSFQKILFGNPGEEVGTGLIPLAEKNNGIGIISYNAMPGTPGGIGSCLIRHKKGHVVSIIAKTYDMSTDAIKGANVGLIAFDEEPPVDIYAESIMRTRGSTSREPGFTMILATLQKGLSEVALKYFPNGLEPENGLIPDEPEKYVIGISMDECPHYTQEDIEALLAEVPMNERETRRYGTPGIGSGRVYPLLEKDVVVYNLKIGQDWPRAYGLDFGWNCTAAIWGAQDPNTKVIYIYAEHYQGKQVPHSHAYAIKQKGSWIMGAPDPAGGGTNQKDGTNLIQEYLLQGLKLAVDYEGRSLADNTINAGIARILSLLESGQLKFCYNCENLLKEFRVYRYDPKDPNRIARNQADHLLDALRYLISIFDRIALSYLDAHKDQRPNEPTGQHVIGRNETTGY